MQKTFNFLLFFFISLFSSTSLLGQWQASIVQYGSDRSLSYTRDNEGNMIPDFSYAGYKNGNEEIPDIIAVDTLWPISGDNTAHIQQAIDQLASLPLDTTGFRGAIYLNPGIYEIHGTIMVNKQGIVLRGAGDGADSSANTILKGIGNTPEKRDIMRLGGGSNTRWTGQVSGTQYNITTPRVLVGERSIEVADASPFQIGDNIVIYHPCTQAWLDAVDGGGTASDDPWTPGSQPIVFNRNIRGIAGNRILLDVPVFNHLDRSLAQSYIYKYDRKGIVTHVGVENLRVDIVTQGGEDENHAWNAIRFTQVEDAWATNCTALHFGLAGFITETATRITIAHCKALDPVAIIEGAKMYNFDLFTASQQILVDSCFASNGRHHYVSNGTSWVSGCVFVDCISDAAHTASEGHRRWSMGLLYDNLKETSVRGSGRLLLGLYNRGSYGTSHGWSSAHSVAWNCDVGSGKIVIQKPPTAQNYAIGGGWIVSGAGPFNHPTGYLEGLRQEGLEPRSLYRAQLFARQNGLVNTRDLLDEPYKVYVYPNPVNTNLKVEVITPFPSQTIISLYDIFGEEFLKLTGLPENQLDISNLAVGVYFLKVSIRNQTRVIKVVKK